MEQPSAISHFEQALKKLNEIIARLEKGELPLEESLQYFEQGITLTRDCHTLLKSAELRIETIIKKNEMIESIPFETEGHEKK